MQLHNVQLRFDQLSYHFTGCHLESWVFIVRGGLLPLLSSISSSASLFFRSILNKCKQHQANVQWFMIINKQLHLIQHPFLHFLPLQLLSMHPVLNCLYPLSRFLNHTFSPSPYGRSDVLSHPTHTRSRFHRASLTLCGFHKAYISLSSHKGTSWSHRAKPHRPFFPSNCISRCPLCSSDGPFPPLRRSDATH